MGRRLNIIVEDYGHGPLLFPDDADERSAQAPHHFTTRMGRRVFGVEQNGAHDPLAREELRLSAGHSAKQFYLELEE